MGHLELDLAEIVIGPRHDNRVVVRRMAGLYLPDEPPGARETRLRVHDLFRLYGGGPPQTQ